MRTFFSSIGLVVAAAACGGSVTSLDTVPSDATASATSCGYPAQADTYTNVSASGCTPGEPPISCEVSNGDTVFPDGAVTGGSATCHSVCPASHYELACRSAGPSASPPPPDPSLGCNVIALPTPQNELFYCCPCSE